MAPRSIPSPRAAGIGKPSLYARYGDKQGLFLAVLRRKIARWTRPFADLTPSPDRSIGRAELENILLLFGRRVAQAAIEPNSVALGRVLVTEAFRFPDLAKTLHEEGWMQGVAPCRGPARTYGRFQPQRYP